MVPFSRGNDNLIRGPFDNEKGDHLPFDNEKGAHPHIDVGGEIQGTLPLCYNKGKRVFPYIKQEASHVDETPSDP